ncbi:DUF2306 domain-containing protein, partial [Bacillus paralicheniformis]|nr:DUF2306 domain-containing protein [Bacillus paralicheniformis]
MLIVIAVYVLYTLFENFILDPQSASFLCHKSHLSDS